MWNRFPSEHRDHRRRIRRAGTTFATRSTRSASRSAASSAPADLAPAAIAASLPRIGGERGDLGGEPLRREVVLRQHDRAAGLRQHVGIGELVLVERVRQRHQDRRPADRRELGDRRGAGARDHEMRRRDARRQVGEERRDLGRRRRAAHRPRARAATSSSRACCTMSSRARSAGSSCAIAGGTMSAMTRAPWLPPNTSRRNGPPAPAPDRAAPPPRAPPGRTGLPVSVALAASAASSVEHAGKAGGDRASTRGASSRLARPITAFARGSWSGCARSVAASSGGTVG